jgi:hypothetical protein
VESTTLRVVRIKSIQPRLSDRTHRVFAMLTLRGSEPLVRLGCSWMVGPKMGKARIKRNPLFLVPEAGIEPAWAC